MQQIRANPKGRGCAWFLSERSKGGIGTPLPSLSAGIRLRERDVHKYKVVGMHLGSSAVW